MFNVTARLITPASELVAAYAAESSKMLAPKLAVAATAIQERASVLFMDALRRRPEYESLVGGRLREEFGLADGRTAADSVVEACGRAVTALPTPAHGLYLGGILVEFGRDLFEAALSSDKASYTSVNQAHVSTQIPWLSWLLFGGTARQTIAQLFISPNGYVVGSRTGRAIMVGDAGWSVPAEFSGTATDNWLTRATEDLEEELATELLGVVSL